MAEQHLRQQLDNANQRIRELEDLIEGGSNACATLASLIFDRAPGGMAIISLTGKILLCNQQAAQIVGHMAGDLTGRDTEKFYHKQEDQSRLRSILKKGERIVNYELPLKARTGASVWVCLNGKPIEYKGETASLVSFADITDYRKALKQVELDEIRFERLYQISEMTDQPESVILDYALDAITTVSGSAIGYIYYLNDDETELTLYAWSKDVMAQCNVESIPESYIVAETGLWGDAVRLRKPVITNDYQKCPNKRGHPEGHIPIINHLNIPVFEEERIIFLAGVANKDGDYTEEDVRQLNLVMNGTWRAIQRKRARAALKAAHERLEEKVRKRTAELEMANKDMAVLNMQLVKEAQERKKTLTALEESEHRFRTLFENNHSVMLLIDFETGNIVESNAAAVEYYGYRADELRGMPIANINTLPEKEIREEMRKAKEEDRSYFSFRHRLADGRVRDVEVFSGPVIINDRKNLYSIVQDVTKRKQAEEALIRYERIISSTPDLISLVDRQYCYQMVNDSYLDTFRKQREEVVGSHVSSIVGKDFFDSVVRERLDRAFSGETFTIENWMDMGEGRTLYLATTFHPVSINGANVDYVSVDSRDITLLKKSEEALKTVAKRLDMATKAGNIGIWERDLTTNKSIWDDKMFDLYDVEPGGLESMRETWRERVHPEDLPEVERELAECIDRKLPFNAEFRIVWRNGGIRNIRAAGSITMDDEGVPLTMTGVNWDVTDQRCMEAELRRLASTDPLTGANNRRQFMERLAEEFERSKRYTAPMVLLSLDIDHFKQINDSFGHPAGDDTLRALVDQCMTTLRATDVFGRVGGEEFLAVLPQTDKNAGMRTAERLRALIERHSVETHGQTIRYTISVGLTEMTQDDEDIEAILKRADDALYLAKNKGRNRVEIT